MSVPLVALCVGHSRKISGKTEGGAVSVAGVSEWTYNRGLALLVHQRLAALGIAAFVEDWYLGSGYTTAMRWVADLLRERQATLALEFHFNAATGTARGHEWLYWHSSTVGKTLAGNLTEHFASAGTGIPGRGPKPRTASDRGGEFLRLTPCPAVICEPFFGDNPKDWQAATDHKPAIARAIANAVAETLI